MQLTLSILGIALKQKLIDLAVKNVPDSADQIKMVTDNVKLLVYCTCACDGV